MPLNEKLLREVQKQILNEPNSFLMRTWIQRIEYCGAYFTGDKGPQPFPDCGTAGCIGGWAVLLQDQTAQNDSSIEGRAMKLLGLDSNSLLHVDYWDVDLQMKYKAKQSTQCRAVIAAEMIERTIQREKEKENAAERKVA